MLDGTLFIGKSRMRRGGPIQQQRSLQTVQVVVEIAPKFFFIKKKTERARKRFKKITLDSVELLR